MNAAIDGFMRDFMGASQRAAVNAGMRGEERLYFRTKMIELAGLVATMPKTYESEANPDPIVTLHYFTAGADFYITEKDMDTDGEGQVQAFGLADLGIGTGGEMGCISIREITKYGAELDFHFTPCLLSTVKKTYVAFVGLCNV